MLARRQIPAEYRVWNKQWGAPFGHPTRTAQRYWGKLLSEDLKTKLAGPFSIQPNSDTREFEYPWAFHAVPLKPDMRVVEVGGGLSGFQFVLSRFCREVVNVDPGLRAKGRGWHCDTESISRLNHLFSASVQLRNCTIQDAQLEEGAYDIVYSLSVMEHLTEDEFWETTEHVWRCLRTGGKFVLTVDLFLNLSPFTQRKSNEFGVNFPAGALSEFRTFALLQGEPCEMYGSSSFDKELIQANLENYYVGRYYPALAQCFVLEKQ